jgi:hypothetical protein
MALTLLRHPAAVPPAPMINAQALFGHHHPARIDVVELWPLVIDGVEYITGHRLLIRRDRLVNVTGDWCWLGYKTTRQLPALSAALRDRPAGTAPVLRFDAQLVCALDGVGAGVMPLVGEHFRDPHAVVFSGKPIGLAYPLDPALASSTLGVVPGVAASWPAETAVTR